MNQGCCPRPTDEREAPISPVRQRLWFWLLRPRSCPHSCFVGAPWIFYGPSWHLFALEGPFESQSPTQTSGLRLCLHTLRYTPGLLNSRGFWDGAALNK